LCTPCDEGGIYVFGFGREDVLFEPLLELQIVSNTAQERHWRMRMGVDQAWHDQGVRAILPQPRAVLVGEASCRADRYDAVVAYRHCSVFDYAALGVYGYDVASGVEIINR